VCAFFDEVEKRTHPTRMGIARELCPLVLLSVNPVEDTPRYSVVLPSGEGEKRENFFCKKRYLLAFLAVEVRKFAKVR